MIKLIDTFIAAALAMTSPEVGYNQVQFTMSDSPVYQHYAKAKGYPEMNAYGRTDCGTTSSGEKRCLVIINSCLIAKDNKIHRNLLKQTIFHEVAHVEDFFVNGRSSNHGKPWKSIMRDWKQSAKVKGNMIKACR